MNTIQERERLKKSLRDKPRRDAFVSAYTDQIIPFQIRALREQPSRNWTQEELASRAGMKQERISTIENPNYGRYSLKTLKQLASAFDVALVVRFVPFSEFVEWKLGLSSGSLEVSGFEEEEYFKEKPTDSSFNSFLNSALKPDSQTVPESTRPDERPPIYLDSQQKPQYGYGGPPSPIDKLWGRKNAIAVS